jgi:hypothetical protein
MDQSAPAATLTTTPATNEPIAATAATNEATQEFRERPAISRVAEGGHPLLRRSVSVGVQVMRFWVWPNGVN